jgi:hypothetical protein
MDQQTQAAEAGDVVSAGPAAVEVEDEADLPAFGRAIADQPGLYASASIASAEPASYATDWSAPDEFFFAPSVNTFGTPVDARAIEGPKPWELPALPAGRDISEFETTRDLTASGLIAPTAAPTELQPVEAEAVVPERAAKPEPASADLETSRTRPAPLAATMRPDQSTTGPDPDEPGVIVVPAEEGPSLDPRYVQQLPVTAEAATSAVESPAPEVPARRFERIFEAPAFEGDPEFSSGLGRPFEASMPVRTATTEPATAPEVVADYARNFDAPVEEPKRRDLGSAFRRAGAPEIPAQRRPADLGDLQPPVQRTVDLEVADRGIPGWGRQGDGTPRPAKPGDLQRPADLRDHLRETRPADLAQYSSKAKPPAEAPRRPASLSDLPPARRPATLADHLGESRRTEEGTS